jgi:hypothetical protein
MMREKKTGRKTKVMKKHNGKLISVKQHEQAFGYILRDIKNEPKWLG